MALKAPLRLVDASQPFATRGAQESNRALKEHADAINNITTGGTLAATRRALVELTVTVGATLEAPYPLTIPRPPGFTKVVGVLLISARNVTTGATSYSLGVPHAEQSGGNIAINYIPGLETSCVWYVVLEVIGS